MTSMLRARLGSVSGNAVNTVVIGDVKADVLAIAMGQPNLAANIGYFVAWLGICGELDCRRSTQVSFCVVPSCWSIHLLVPRAEAGSLSESVFMITAVSFQYGFGSVWQDH